MEKTGDQKIEKLLSVQIWESKPKSQTKDPNLR